MLRKLTGILLAGLILALPSSALAQSDGGQQQEVGPLQLQAVPVLAQSNAAFSQAAALVAQLQSARPSVTLLVDYSQDTDPEYLLGLPGQYQAKATFADSVMSAAPGTPTGSIEVFARATQLQNRLSSMLRTPGEHDIIFGAVLVRVFVSRGADDLNAYCFALSPSLGQCQM
jgi:hypothetical protein